MAERTNSEWIELAMREGREGGTYQWMAMGGKAVKSTDWLLPDGVIVGIPHMPGYGVEVRYPDGRREYP